jgi:glycosyltransferase involved in cell wall biosynthesis
VDKVIRAIGKCRDAGVNISLDIVGRIHSTCENLPELCKSLELDDAVSFVGEVSEDVFQTYFVSSDLCIVLRDPTVGETSAVVSRAIQYGLPLIVNDTGSYSELPSFVPKIALGAHTITDLAETLLSLSRDRARYNSMANAAYSFATTEGSFMTATKLYSETIRSFVS